jgi:hypothetical protein
VQKSPIKVLALIFWNQDGIPFIDYTGEQKIFFSLVPWFLSLFLGLFGALIQKNASALVFEILLNL